MAKIGIKSQPVEFKLIAPKARKVSVAGTFNNWDTAASVAQKDTKGNWKVKLNLKPGRYEYKFVVDGNWMNDPKANSSVYNSFGSQNSLIEIK